MSSSFSVYVGPYMKVPTFVRLEAVHSHTCSAACGGPNVKRIGATTAVCADCGAKASHTERQEDKLTVPSPHDLESQFEDFAFMPESCCSNAQRQDLNQVVWMPNKRGFGSTFSSEDANHDAIDLPMDDLDHSMVGFIDKYGPFIAAAEAHFGVTIEICYGVVPYTH